MAKAALKESKDSGAAQRGTHREDERFTIATCATFTLRLLRRYPQLFDKALAPIFDMLPLAKTQTTVLLADNLKTAFRNDCIVELADCEDGEDTARSVLRYLRLNRGRLLGRLRRLLLELLEAAVHAGRKHPRSRLEANLEEVRGMFGLSPLEAQALLFVYLAQSYPPAEMLFKHRLDCADLKGRPYTAAALGINLATMAELLQGKLSNFGVDASSYWWNLDDNFLLLLQNPLTDAVREKMFRRAKLDSVSLDWHQVPSQTTEHLHRLLKASGKAPVHLLLYGGPGTGKTSYAKGLASLVGLPTFEILSDEGNKNLDRRKAITACLAVNNHGAGALILVDEADNILNTRGSWLSQGESRDKGWLNQLLEEPRAKVIWVTNSIDSIEESVRRRFTFSLHFKPLGLQQRCQVWNQILRRHRAVRLFKEDELQRLARRYKVSPGVMDLAVGQAKVSAGNNRTEFMAAVEMALQSHLTLALDGGTIQKDEGLDQEYSLEGLNTDCDLKALAQQLTSCDELLRGPSIGKMPSINLLFYGPPGTGKSELARHLARRLDRELMVRRASDLLDPYVGMTERKIKEAFEEAERDQALLVVDEVDSFLFKRGQSQRSWEISTVNEFLTQMERFKGILVCTTNRLPDLDEASIRRFAFKVGFDFLTEAGNEHFYGCMLAPLVKEKIDTKILAEVRGLKGISPGDFALVRNQFKILPRTNLTHNDLLEALAKEYTIKQGQNKMERIGFAG